MALSQSRMSLPLRLIALDAAGSLLIAMGVLSFVRADLPLVRLIDPVPAGILCIAAGIGLTVPLILWAIRRAQSTEV